LVGTIFCLLTATLLVRQDENHLLHVVIRGQHRADCRLERLFGLLHSGDDDGVDDIARARTVRISRLIAQRFGVPLRSPSAFSHLTCFQLVEHLAPRQYLMLAHGAIALHRFERAGQTAGEVDQQIGQHERSGQIDIDKTQYERQRQHEPAERPRQNLKKTIPPVPVFFLWDFDISHARNSLPKHE
jgi:hypothetical protein